MGLLPKEYLNFQEVEEYLISKGYKYSARTLKYELLELLRQDYLCAYYYYNDDILVKVYEDGYQGYIYLDKDYYDKKCEYVKLFDEPLEKIFHYGYTEVNLITSGHTGKGFIAEEHYHKDGGYRVDFKDLRFLLDDIDKLFPTITNDKLEQQEINNLNQRLIKANEVFGRQALKMTEKEEEIQQLKAELAQAKEQLSQTQKQALPATDDILSNELTNVEIINQKQKILGKSNNLIAKAIKSLDISNILTKDDIAKFILPYSQSMVSFLNDMSKSEQTTSIKTIKDNHLKEIAFKNGKPSKKDSEKQRIDLIFDRTKLSDTEN